MTTSNPTHQQPDQSAETPAPQAAKKPDVGLKSNKQSFLVFAVGVIALVGLVVVARMYT